jgi:plasmid stability protein
MSLAIDKQDNKNGAMPEIVIRNVPDIVHQRLQERAASLEITFQELLLRIISQEVNLMTWSQVFQELEPYRTSSFTHEELMKVIDDVRNER